MRRIIGKGWITQLNQLAEIGFEETELQIRNEADFEINPLHPDVRIFTLHEWKGDFKVDGKRVWGNIGDAGELGDKSEELLGKHIAYAKEHGIERLVIHPGFTNIFEREKEAALDTVARRLERIHDPAVKICIENSEFRPDFTAYSNERLVVDADDLGFLLRRCEVPLQAIVDIEHLYATTIFKAFYEELKPVYEKIKTPSDKAKADNLAEKILVTYANEDPEQTKKQISDFVEQYFRQWNSLVEAIHVCGSDYLNYKRPKNFVQKGPNPAVLIGSHLPIGFSGIIDQENVEDRVDHEQYLKLSHKNTPIVIEVTAKGMSEGYIYWLKESKENLDEIVKPVKREYSTNIARSQNMIYNPVLNYCQPMQKEIDLIAFTTFSNHGTFNR